MSSLELTPLDRRLLDWLENDTPRFEKYITSHPEAGDRIDQILELGAVFRDRLNNALFEAIAAPVDLAERLTASIGKDRSTDAASVALDIFGVGPRTVGLLFG